MLESLPNNGEQGFRLCSGDALNSLWHRWITVCLGLYLFAFASAVSAGTYTLLSPHGFQRQTGPPITETVSFTARDPSGVYTINVYNGGLVDHDLTGELVSSSVITLNGTQIFWPSEFNQNVSTVSKPVTLQSNNELTVELWGKPGGVITLEIIGEDSVAPTITATVDPAANSSGWHRSDATVNFQCDDATSGIATCPSPVVVFTEGVAQIITGTAVDRAGNQASTSVTLNIDKSPPTVMAQPNPVANAAGWNNTAVQVGFDCQDTLSGVATCTAPVTIATEGAGQIVTGNGTDVAGNSTSASVTLNIDQTLPTITAQLSSLPNAAGWFNQAVTVTFNCADTLSGIATCTEPQIVSIDGQGQTVTGTAQDSAGNTASVTVSLNIDKTPPVITPQLSLQPNAAGWFNQAVTVSFVCTDTLSGVASCPPPQTISGEGLGQIVNGTAQDSAGNTASVLVTLNIDQSPPVIATQFSAQPNAAGWINQAVTLSFNCTDTLSGIASCTSPQTISTDGQGQTVTGTAQDNAGNTASQTHSLNIDTTAPTIQFTAPVAGDFLLNKQPNIQLTVADNLALDASSLILTVNGAAFDGTCNVDNGVATCVSNSDLPSGDVTLLASVADLAGNQASSQVAFHIQANLVLIDSPATLTTVAHTPITVTGTVDPGIVSLTVNGNAVNHSNGAFQTSVTLEQGLNTIVARVVDATANVSTASIAIYLDVTPPFVTIDSPLEGQTVFTPSVAVSGLVNDIVRGTISEAQANVTVNGVQASVANRSYLAENVPLQVGANVITVSASDEVGNTNSTSITVTHTPPIGKQIELVSGQNQRADILTPLPAPLRVKLLDASNNPVANKNVVFRVTQGSGVLAVGTLQEAQGALATTDASGIAETTFKLGARSGNGNHKVRARAVGFSGEVIFFASADPKPPNKISVNSGNNQRGAVAQPLPHPFVVVVTDEGTNVVEGIQVEFKVVQGGSVFQNGDRTFQAITDSDGRATAQLILGLEPGLDIHDIRANLVGSSAFAGFTASALIPGDPGNTAISGLVLDNQDNPVPGVTVRVDSTTRQATVDAQGHFTITQVPVGPVHLMVDGSTTTRAGEWPTLSYELVTISGADNTLPGPIYILPLATDTAVQVGAQDVEYTLPEVPGFKLTVKAGSVTFPDGSKTGQLSVTTVNSSKVPMAPPNGMQPQFIVTIQPVGTMFDPPAPLTLPNVDGHLPGSQVEMFSYDHDLEEFVTIGLGTVSKDGTIIESNPGVGVIKAGWHCGAQPAGDGCCSGPDSCGERCTQPNPGCDAGCSAVPNCCDPEVDCPGECSRPKAPLGCTCEPIPQPLCGECEIPGDNGCSCVPDTSHKPKASQTIECVTEFCDGVPESKPDGTICNTADRCLEPGSCLGGSCQPGPPVDCDDANECTADSCGANGCEHDPLTNSSCCDGLQFDSVTQGCCNGTIYNVATFCCNQSADACEI